MNSKPVNMELKSQFSFLAIVLTFFAFIPYILSILKNQTKPHFFSWMIWGITTIIVFIAQFKEKGGLGTYPIGISGVITLFIAVLAYIKKPDPSIRKMDYFFLMLSLSSLPFWYLTSNSFIAVFILTVVDLLGFAPTFRKAYNFPFEESVLFFSIFIVRNLLSILALENQTITTILFPFAVATGCFLLVLLILFRRVQKKLTF